MDVLGLLGTVFAGCGVIGGIGYWLLRNENRVTALETRVEAYKYIMDGLIAQNELSERETKEFSNFVRTRLAVMEQKIKEVRNSR